MTDHINHNLSVQTIPTVIVAVTIVNISCNFYHFWPMETGKSTTATANEGTSSRNGTQRA